MKMIGKPYSGKLNVRFDEGELEIEPRLLRQFPTLPMLPNSASEITRMPAIQAVCFLTFQYVNPNIHKKKARNTLAFQVWLPE